MAERVIFELYIPKIFVQLKLLIPVTAPLGQ